MESSWLIQGYGYCLGRASKAAPYFPYVFQDTPVTVHFNPINSKLSNYVGFCAKFNIQQVYTPVTL
jgi:hypothetical protein